MEAKMITAKQYLEMYGHKYNFDDYVDALHNIMCRFESISEMSKITGIKLNRCEEIKAVLDSHKQHLVTYPPIDIVNALIEVVGAFKGLKDMVKRIGLDVSICLNVKSVAWECKLLGEELYGYSISKLL